MRTVVTGPRGILFFVPCGLYGCYPQMAHNSLSYDILLGSVAVVSHILPTFACVTVTILRYIYYDKELIHDCCGISTVAFCGL